MPTGQQYASNTNQTTLTSSITNNATSMSVASGAGWPATPFTVALDIGSSSQELVDVTNVAGTTFTVTRAVDGTTGVVHSNGATVTHVHIARDDREARSHMDASGTSGGTTVHGTVGGVVVSTTDSQTLTNKTLTSPTINTGTLASPVVSGTLSGTYTSSATVTNTGTIKDLATTQSAVGTTAITATGLASGTGDLLNLVDGAANQVFRVEQNGASGAGHVLIAPSDTSGTPALTINSPTGVGPFAMQINGVDKWKIAGTGNLTSTGATTAIDISAFTNVKPIIGPVFHSYTPTFGGTGFSLGNGTATGGYIQYGNITFFESYLIVGSTTALTTAGNALTMTLPLTVFNYSLFEIVMYRPASSAFVGRALASNLSSGGSTVNCYMFSGASGALATLDRTVPYNPPATNDVVFVRGWFQATT